VVDAFAFLLAVFFTILAPPLVLTGFRSSARRLVLILQYPGWVGAAVCASALFPFVRLFLWSAGRTLRVLTYGLSFFLFPFGPASAAFFFYPKPSFDRTSPSFEILREHGTVGFFLCVTFWRLLFDRWKPFLGGWEVSFASEQLILLTFYAPGSSHPPLYLNRTNPFFIFRRGFFSFGVIRVPLFLRSGTGPLFFFLSPPPLVVGDLEVRSPQVSPRFLEQCPSCVHFLPLKFPFFRDWFSFPCFRRSFVSSGLEPPSTPTRAPSLFSPSGHRPLMAQVSILLKRPDFRVLPFFGMRIVLDAQWQCRGLGLGPRLFRSLGFVFFSFTVVL